MNKKFISLISIALLTFSFIYLKNNEIFIEIKEERKTNREERRNEKN